MIKNIGKKIIVMSTIIILTLTFGMTNIKAENLNIKEVYSTEGGTPAGTFTKEWLDYWYNQNNENLNTAISNGLNYINTNYQSFNYWLGKYKNNVLDIYVIGEPIIYTNTQQRQVSINITTPYHYSINTSTSVINITTDETILDIQLRVATQNYNQNYNTTTYDGLFFGNVKIYTNNNDMLNMNWTNNEYNNIYNNQCIYEPNTNSYYMKLHTSHIIYETTSNYGTPVTFENMTDIYDRINNDYGLSQQLLKAKNYLDEINYNGKYIMNNSYYGGYQAEVNIYLTNQDKLYINNTLNGIYIDIVCTKVIRIRGDTITILNDYNEPTTKTIMLRYYSSSTSGSYTDIQSYFNTYYGNIDIWTNPNIGLGFSNNNYGEYYSSNRLFMIANENSKYTFNANTDFQQLTIEANKIYALTPYNNILYEKGLLNTFTDEFKLSINSEATLPKFYVWDNSINMLNGYLGWKNKFCDANDSTIQWGTGTLSYQNERDYIIIDNRNNNYDATLYTYKYLINEVNNNTIYANEIINYKLEEINYNSDTNKLTIIVNNKSNGEMINTIIMTDNTSEQVERIDTTTADETEIKDKLNTFNNPISFYMAQINTIWTNALEDKERTFFIIVITLNVVLILLKWLI